MTKHTVLITFESDSLPTDFLDQVAGRVYGMTCVKKTECTAVIVGDVSDAKIQEIAESVGEELWPNEAGIEWFETDTKFHREFFNRMLFAAKDTQ